MKVTELVTQFSQPIIESFGCSLWDVEYVREGSERYLRIYVDKEGGIDINDCERIHRAIDPILDEKDPIAESYHFEVCSAGIELVLKKPENFLQFMNSPVLVKLYRPRNGLKELPGILRGYEDGRITLEAGKETITFEKSEVALVRLRVEF
jgi:ribosome maturation factor RimP